MSRRLTDIANEFGTDKGSVDGPAHTYTAVYEMLLEPFRTRPLNLLEIGLAVGGPELGNPASRDVNDMPSVRMWREYMPQAHIHGLDISDFSRFQTNWFTFYQADCGDSAQLQRFADKGIQFDVIIDDGSHASYHQQLTLLTLFGTLKPGGLYFIEDLQWVPPSYESQLPRVPRTRDLLADFLINGRFVHTGAIAESRWAPIAEQVSNVLLFQDDYFEMARRRLAAGTRRKSELLHYFDLPFLSRLKHPSYPRRVYEAIVTLGRALIGALPRESRARLAALQKGIVIS